MKLKILDDDALALFKDNKFIEQNLNRYVNYSDTSWLVEAFGRSPFIETKYEINDLKFNMSADEGRASDTEFDNVKEVYSKLRFLSDSNATEERLWACLCLTEGNQYSRYRWKKQLSSVQAVKDHLFFGQGNKRRSYTRNAMARLWWIGRLTFDESNKPDPWRLTRFVCENADYVLHFLERTTSNNMNILKPFLTTLLDIKESGVDINTDDAGALSKELNILGASYALDFMSEKWLRNKFTQMINDYIKSKNDEDGVPSESDHQDVESVDEEPDEEKITVDKKSRVVLQRNTDGKIILVNATGDGFRMKPKNLIGLKIGDTVKIGKMIYTIYSIK